MIGLLAKVRWRVEGGKAPERAGESFSNGRLTLHLDGAQRARGDDSGLFYSAETQVLCSVVGRVSNMTEAAAARSVSGSSHAEMACRLYSEAGVSFVRELDGIFLICLFDERAEKAYVFQSSPGFNLAVYYSGEHEFFLLGTGLKGMLRHSTKTRELDLDAARDFLHWHMLIPNNSTLVKHMSKLMPETYLLIDYRKRTVAVGKCAPRRHPGMSRKEAKRDLLPSIERSARWALDQCGNRRVVVTLTGGWDCNLVLHMLRRITDAPIDAVTVDGGGAMSEIEPARLILSNYERVRHMTCEVPQDLGHLPDLVWRGECAFFNEGMFLRYALGDFLRGEGIDCIILGSSADQVLWPEGLTRKILRHARVTGRRIAGRESPESGLRRRLGEGHGRTLYDMPLELNLKMHGILLNSFGVQCLFPFVNARNVEIGRALGLLYNWRKRVYVGEVMRALPGGVTRYLKKSRQVVDNMSIFAANRERLVAALKTDLSRTILGLSETDRVAARPEDYHLLVVQLACLNVFNELFISGEYDSVFDSENLDVPLGELL